MFAILQAVFDFLWKGIEAYASTDEGRAELDDILNAVENAGIDIPFYEPKEPPLDVSEGSGQQSNQDFSDFLSRHPEYAKSPEGDQ